MTHSAPAARLAIVGDRSPHVRAHVRLPGLVAGLRERDGLALDTYWIPTEDVTAPDVLDGFDGIYLAPGSPYRSEEGAIAAAGTARTRGIPFLGTCGGFQHALLEYARNVCGLAGRHAQNDGVETVDGSGDDLVIVPLACSLVGHEGAVRITPGTLAERILGVDRTVERYHCSYGLNKAHLATLAAHGMRFSGHDDDGDVRIAELPDHPFFLGTLFQPELAGEDTRAHPILRAFAAAVVAHAGITSAA